MLLATDAAGALQGKEQAGIAWVLAKDVSLISMWTGRKAVSTDLSILLEMQALVNGLECLKGVKGPHHVYSDCAQLFQYFQGRKVPESQQELYQKIWAVYSRGDYTFERVLKARRHRYPLYLIADLLSRTIRTEAY